jgi:predicted TIM-barrel fold metal-dependent hydrolase
MKKIDIHCHTSNRFIREVETQLPNIKAIERMMVEYEVEKTILLATYFPHKKSGISNFRLYDWIRDNPKFLMFGSLDFEYYPHQGLNELEEMAERKIIAGVKIYTCYQRVDLDSSTFKSVISIAKKHQLPMMFHTGISYASMRKYDTPTIANMHTAKTLFNVIKSNPDITFIMSHMSKPFFDEVAAVCLNHHNAYTDMSGLIDSKYDEVEIPSSIEVIKKFLEYCGPGKLLWGTDFPVQTHAHSQLFIEEAVKGFGVKATEAKELMYYKNAKSILK